MVAFCLFLLLENPCGALEFLYPGNRSPCRFIGVWSAQRPSKGVTLPCPTNTPLLRAMVLLYGGQPRRGKVLCPCDFANLQVVGVRPLDAQIGAAEVRAMLWKCSRP